MINYLLALIIALIVLAFGMAAWNHSAAELEIARARAGAILIEARAEARATTLIALVPWGIILAVSVPVTILALKWQPRRVITFQIEAGVPRRELWRILSDQSYKVIEHESTKGS